FHAHILISTAFIHCSLLSFSFSSVSFFNAPAPTEIYTLSLHDALPIYHRAAVHLGLHRLPGGVRHGQSLEGVRHPDLALVHSPGDRKSTRLNSSHLGISYAVFCLKKKKQ